MMNSNTCVQILIRADHKNSAKDLTSSAGFSFVAYLFSITRKGVKYKRQLPYIKVTAL